MLFVECIIDFLTHKQAETARISHYNFMPYLETSPDDTTIVRIYRYHPNHHHHRTT